MTKTVTFWSHKGGAGGARVRSIIGSTGTMLDLFQIAADNAGALDERMTSLALMHPGSSKPLRMFASFVEREGRLSLNFRLDRFVDFLISETYDNAHSLADWWAEELVLSSDDLLRAFLKKYWELRVAFDGCFSDGETFRYAALNAGSLGVLTFGDLCVVLEAAAVDENRVAYLRSDSLKTFMRADATLDEPLLRAEISPHSHRGVFAAVKHSSECASSPEAAWPWMLCSTSEFIEAVFQADLRPACIAEARISQDRHRLLHRLVARLLLGEALHEADRAVATDFARVLRGLEKLGLKLTPFSEAPVA